MFNALLHEGNPMYNFQLVHSKGQSIPTLSIYVQLVFAVPLLKTIQNRTIHKPPEHPDKHHHYPNSHPEPFSCSSEDFWLSFLTEEHPPEVKPDRSPPVVKKEEPVIIEVEIKAKDGAAPVATATPPTASSGSGRRKKKQKVELSSQVRINQNQTN